MITNLRSIAEQGDFVKLARKLHKAEWAKYSPKTRIITFTGNPAQLTQFLSLLTTYVEGV